MSIIEATVGSNCGATAGNATAAMAAACDGSSSCSYQIDSTPGAAVADGCAKDFRVTWRCATEETVRTTLVPPDPGLGAIVALRCDAPAAARIDVLSAATGTAASADVTVAIANRCSGRERCTITPQELAPLRGAGATSLPLRVQWRCEGEMAARVTTVAAGEPARLACGGAIGRGVVQIPKF
jgi:hypothetical protein